ncbi:hypothetical protein BKA70DRAFT_1423513 [Coprinopsis sp. MPI-PUGE-AT-0042]|nr:hypothetical protein BKA70DRAFT_1423513 [Coprinopsis sp. MPI-PUGE-AT-0042]
MSTPSTAASMPVYRAKANSRAVNPPRDSFTMQLLHEAQRIEVTEEWKLEVNTTLGNLLDYVQRIEQKIDSVCERPVLAGEQPQRLRGQKGNVVLRLFWAIVNLTILAVRVVVASIALYFVGWHLYDGRLLRIIGVRAARILAWFWDYIIQA